MTMISSPIPRRMGWIFHLLLAGRVALGAAGDPQHTADAGRPVVRPLAPLVVDDADAVFVGKWIGSVKQPPLVGDSYHHDNSTGRGTKTATFTVKLPGSAQYEVRLIYTPHENRATNVPVTVRDADGERTVLVNQRETLLIDGIPRALGVFSFDARTPARIVVSNDQADGFVVVDAVQLVPVEVARADRVAAAKRRKARRSEPVSLAATANPADVAGKSYDLVVVGGTPGGVACAVRAAREGATVLLVHSHRHLGGMMANGLGQWDALYGGHRGPLFSELLRNIEDYYREVYGPQSRDYLVARFTQQHYPLGWTEPHVAEREFHRLVAGERRITLLCDHVALAVERNGTLLCGVTLRETDGTNDIPVTGKIFADATYEGDLLALAKVPYRVGREARDEYQEPHAGKLFTNIAKRPAPTDAVEGRLNIRPYGLRQGSIDPASPFTADGAVQAYNYRLCLTCDPANRILLSEPPPHYDRNEYLPFERKYLAASTGPNQKSHMNSPILPGENHAYPEADRGVRRQILQRHLEFALGLVYFLQNDESVSPAQRAKFREWGLPRDEFPDNGHVPYEMYVREARRIVGRHVYSEHDNSLAPGLQRTPIHGDNVAITDWYMDSHACTTDSRPGYKYDGKLILTEQSRPGQIPYRALLPRGVDNLLVPVCLSSTHVAWGAVRLEPVWMQTGEAAGFAAALAVQHETTPGQLPPDLLLRTLVERRMLVSFFNDVDVAGDQPWIAAVQYFGTKGCFAGYDARPEQPLTATVAREWAETFGQLLSGTLDPGQRAAALPAADPADSDPVSARRFAGMLDQQRPAAGRDPATRLDRLGISPDQAVSRGDACRMMMARLPAERSVK